ncbi:sensor histidine kinase [Frigoriflavimonas asaccharolytica]|uniref:ATP-binding protein n=1 Tax=Frigoriflavimonas asaccharolytica TaxID=2735899 RepID=A0A8J8KA97_9FLAO|nr:hypothetical protein [Frigoriflavimonas asaccharolytica]NRS91249.1 hypothetical protein [Frigoriflavimonas asaccharolytica]
MKYLYLLLFVLFSCKKNENAPNKQNNNGDFLYDQAFTKLDNNQKEIAYSLFSKAKIEYLKSHDSLCVAKCEMNMAVIQNEYGDITGSQENAIEALKFFASHNDSIYISTTLNILGTNEISSGNSKQSIKYLNKAIFHSVDNLERNVILNNKAIAFSKIQNNDSCLIILNNLAKTDPSQKARYIDNFEYYSWKKDNNYNAEPKMLEALEMRVEKNDLMGQNASHAHLADFYEEKNTERSLFHAYKMYDIAKQLKNPDDQLEALEKLVKIENPSNSKKYFVHYLALKESINKSRSNAKNQFAVIRYESEKERENYLKLEAEKVEENYQLLIRNIALVLSVSFIILSIFWYKKRKISIEQDRELEIKRTELKFSKKIHDVVSNGVYQVMSEIENKNEIDKNQILNKLENLYEKSRDISYENSTINLIENYQKRISTLVDSFSSDSLKPIIIGNENEIWNQISTKIHSEFFIILQELLVNMKKHSHAQKLILKFEIVGKMLIFKYMDDGIGMEQNVNKKNGLQNMENRIFSCQGNITFDKINDKGTCIKISFPLKNN